HCSRSPNTALFTYTTLFRSRCFLGLDVGSTTTKAVLIDEEGSILYTYYGSNKGKPLQSVRQAVLGLYAALPDGAWIANSAVTGYGEGLIKAALQVDLGEIETVAHYKAADFLDRKSTRLNSSHVKISYA